MKPVIVVPTIRQPEVFKNFLIAWKKDFEGCTLIVVEDRPKKILEPLIKQYHQDFLCYDWKDIDTIMGNDSWIIPRKSDCVRSFGFLMAKKLNPLFIVTLDDDVIPEIPGIHIKTFYNILFNFNYNSNKMYNTLKYLNPRGIVKNFSEVYLVHGGWIGIPDLSAEEEIVNSGIIVSKQDFNEGFIPVNCYFPMCGMNIAFKPELLPYSYFGLQGGSYIIDRCGDIWAGFKMKEYVDSIRGSVYSGKPFVVHNRLSNSWVNLEKEKNAKIMTNMIVNNNKVGFKEYWCLLDTAYEVWNKWIVK